MELVANNEAPKRPRSTRTSFVINTDLLDWVEQEAERLGTSKSAVYVTALAEYKQSRDGGGADWSTVDDDTFYDPHHFYTQALDKKGHGSHARVTLPIPLSGAIAALVQSGQIPQYRTSADVIRDAVYHRVKAISRALDDGELEETVDMAMLLADELQIAAKRDEAETFVAAIRTNADGLWENGERAALRKYLADRENLIDSIPNPYSRELQELISSYRKKLNRGKRRVT